MFGLSACSLSAVVVVAACLTAAAPSADGVSEASAYSSGDVFLAVGGTSAVRQYNPRGTPIGRYVVSPKQPVDSVFDADGDLLISTFFGPIYRFDPQGRFAGVFADTTTDGLPGLPRSMIRDAAGHIFVGAQSRDINNEEANVVREYDSGGALIDHFTVQTTDHSVVSIDLSADQCTLHYTSYPSSILTYNVCTRTQEAPVTTSLPVFGDMSLREIPNSGGQFLVGGWGPAEALRRIGPDGTVLQSYPVKPDYTGDFKNVVLDPDGTSVWTTDNYYAYVYRLRIADGRQLRRWHVHTPLSGTGDEQLAGLAVFGERTAALAITGT
jgi:hypothetical protein